MKFFEKARRLIELDRYLREESTGSLGVLGEKLGISRAQMFIHLNALKEFGFPIVWNSQKQSYIYSDPDLVEVRFPVIFKHKI
ncbi:MAG: hypothetical protein RIS47_2327 [Bacteroidota bacterium]|jgi:biotin operon repressor